MMDLDLSSEITEILDSEIGSDATLTTASPAGSSDIRVVFHKMFSSEDFGNDIDREAYEIWIEGKASDFTDAAQNDTLLIDGTTYVIERLEYESDDSQWIKVGLTIQ